MSLRILLAVLRALSCAFPTGTTSEQVICLANVLARARDGGFTRPGAE